MSNETSEMDNALLFNSPEVGSCKIQKMDYKAALECYNETERKKILECANSIDVTKYQNVMSYGSLPMKRSFDTVEMFLKEEAGSDADQEVIRQVIEISKAANTAQSDFNISVQEPNWFRKFLYKVTNNSYNNKILKQKATTCFELLKKLRSSYDSWINMIQKTNNEVFISALDDRNNCRLLEQYIVAGHIARERVLLQLEKAKDDFEKSSGLQEYEDFYIELKDGLQIFDMVLLNLEKSRAIYKISIAQLKLQAQTNMRLQVTLQMQKENGVATAGLQLRNSLFNAKTREAVEGQNSIMKLNDELMKSTSKNISKTAIDVERAMENGSYTVEAAISAAQIVVDCCNEIKDISAKREMRMNENLVKIRGLINDLEPHISSIKGIDNNTSVSEVNMVETDTELKF